MSSIRLDIEYNERMIELNVDRNSKISFIKNEIYEKECILISQQKLLFEGRRLNNNRSLAYYNICNNNSLILEKQATSRQFWISFIYFGSFIGLGLFMGSPGPILKQLQYQTLSSLKLISFIFSARAIGYIIGSIIFGLISDKYAQYYNKYGKFNNKCYPFRPHYLFCICLILLSFSMSILIYIDNIISLIIIMNITGICSGGIDCFGNVLLLTLFDTDNEKDILVAPYMQLLHFAFAIGAFLSPLIIQLSIYKYNTYQYAFWLMSIESIIFAIIILFIDTPLRKRKKKTTSSTATTNNKYIINYGSFDETSSSSSTVTTTTTTTTTKTKSTYYYRIFIVLSCAIFLGIYVGSEVSFGGYITIYSINYLNTSQSIGRYINSIYWGGLSFGRLSSVYISKKLKPIYMLIFDLFGCFIASSILYLFNKSINFALIASILYGFFMASIFPSIFLIAEQTVKVDGRYASIMIFGASCGEFIIPAIEGNLINDFGEKYFNSITIILVIILFIVFIILLFAIYFSDIYKKIKNFFCVN